MAERFQVEIEVDDKGTAKLHAFGRAATKVAQDVSSSSLAHGRTFSSSWDSALGRVGGAFKGFIRTIVSAQGAMVGLVASIGLFKAAQYIKDVASVAGRYEELGVAMFVAGKNANFTAIEMLKLEDAVRKQGIAAVEARETLVRMSVAQINLAESAKLARAAQDLAVVGAMNSSEAFSNLIYGIQTAEVRVLRTIGLNVSFERGYETLAASIGKNSQKLSEQEKIQSRVNTVLEAATKFQGLYEAAMTSAEKQQRSLTRYIDNYKVAFGQAFQPAYLEIVKVKTELYKKLAEILSDPAPREALQRLAGQFASLYTSVLSKIPDMVVWFSKLNDRIDDVTKALSKFSESLTSIIAIAAIPTMIKLIIGLTASLVGLNLAFVALGATIVASRAMVAFLGTLAAAIVSINPVILALLATLVTYEGYKIWKNWGEGVEGAAIDIKHLREEAGRGNAALKELTSSLDIQIETWGQLDKLIQDGIIAWDAAINKFIEVKEKLGDTPSLPPPPEDPAERTKRLALQKQTIDELMQLTKTELDYSIWALDQEYEERKKILGKSLELEKWHSNARMEIELDALWEMLDSAKEQSTEQIKITEELTNRTKELALNEYDYEIYLIDEKFKKLKESYKGEIDLTEWKSSEIADIEKRRLEEMTEKQEEAAKKWTDAISSFFDDIVGQGNDLASWWSNWLDRLKGWFFKAISQMVAQWIVGTQMMSANGPTMSMAGVAGGMTGGGGILSNLFGLGGGGGGTGISGIGGLFGGGSWSGITGGLSGLVGGIGGSFGALGSLVGMTTVAGTQLATAGVGLLGTIGAALPAIGIIGGAILGIVSLFSSLFGGKKALKKMRNKRRAAEYTEFLEDIGGVTDIGEFSSIMDDLKRDKYENIPAMAYDWHKYDKFEESLRKYGADKGAPYGEWKETVGELDDFLRDLKATLTSTGEATAASGKAFADYKDAIAKLGEYMPGWTEDAQTYGQAMLDIYSNLQVMMLTDLLDQYVEKTLAWTEVLKALNSMGLTPLEKSAFAVSKLLTPLMDTVAIGSDKFFEMYQVINMNARALGDYQVAADRMTTIQSILASGAELTQDQLVDLVTYYRLLKDVLEGNIVSVVDLNAAWADAQNTFEELSGTIINVTQALNIWQQMVLSVQGQILGLQISTANPQPGIERLAILKQQITEATGGMPTSTYLSSLRSDQERLGAVSNLQGLFSAYMTLAQEVYQRPSIEYQDIYDSTIAELRKLEEFSTIQVSIYDVQVEQLNYLQMIADNTAVLSNIPEYQRGGSVRNTGLALVHKGEEITPAGGGVNVNITVNESKTPGSTGQAVSREVIAMLRSGVGRKLISEIARRS